MNLFESPEASHQHSLRTLELIAGYDDYLDKLSVICDMGCGAGLDLMWWANLTYLDTEDREVRRNYKCIGVDLNTAAVPTPTPKNVVLVNRDFDLKATASGIDLLWSHDSFRYSTNPLHTLKIWNEQMNVNGMMVLIVPQMVNIVYNKPVTRTLPGSYFSYNITNLMYLLATNGFDCKDGHFVKYPGDPWIHCVVYKSDIAPMNPSVTSWYDLVEKKLLPDTADDCISKYGYLKQEVLQTHWLDGQYIDWSKV